MSKWGSNNNILIITNNFNNKYFNFMSASF